MKKAIISILIAILFILPLVFASSERHRYEDITVPIKDFRVFYWVSSYADNGGYIFGKVITITAKDEIAKNKLLEEAKSVIAKKATKKIRPLFRLGQ